MVVILAVHLNVLVGILGPPKVAELELGHFNVVVVMVFRRLNVMVVAFGRLDVAVAVVGLVFDTEKEEALGHFNVVVMVVPISSVYVSMRYLCDFFLLSG